MFYPISKLLEINGFYCLTYSYPTTVFSPKAQRTVHNLLHIRNAILHKIAALKKEGYNDFSLFGTSLGSLIALLIANESPDVNKIILNTASINLAQNVWDWDKTIPEFKTKLLKQKLTLTKLKKLWHPISPLNNLDHLHGKKILIYLSQKDEVIPCQPLEIHKQMAQRHYSYKLIITNTVGHVFTSTYNLLNAPIYLDFLKTP